MHVYIQWPIPGQPLEKETDEFEARHAISARFPSAEFSPRQKLGGMVPGFDPTNLDDGVIVMPDKAAKKPVAVIWFPVP